MHVRFLCFLSPAHTSILVCSRTKIAVLDMEETRTVCVIGAGLSGLVTAKVLKHDGFDVTVFEKAPTIGGVWAPSRAYPGLRAVYC